MEYIQQFWQEYSLAILDFATALAFLFAFYIAAVILRSVTRRLMKKTSIDNKFVQVIGLNEHLKDRAAKLKSWLDLHLWVRCLYDG